MKRKKIEILWFIEHVAREMDVACAVKCLAESKYGLEIEIKHIYLHANEVMQQYEPKVIVSPFFYNSKDLAIKDYVNRWPSAIFFNLAWEELFYKGHEMIKAPVGDFSKHNVIHHAWGEFFKSFLIQNGVDNNNIFLNGNPAYKLYQAPYNKYYKKKIWLAKKYNLDEDKRWIIIPENYRWAFINDSTINWRASQGANRNELLEMRLFARESLRYLLKWCNSTAKNENFDLIFRPKPVTMQSEMENFFNEQVKETKSSGLHFIKGESVREWILASDVVISSFSTTLIEAAIASKPAYMVEPLPITESFSADWYEHVPRIKNESEFRTACMESTLSSSYSLKKWAEAEMLANGDPISNLVDFVYSLTQRKTIKKETFSRLMYLFRAMRLAKTKNYFNPRTHEDDSFDDDYVNTKVEGWGKILQSKRI